MSDTEKCRACGWSYETGSVQPLVTNEGRFPMCAVCAFDVRGGIPFAEDSMAELLYEDALDWRAEHPECGPMAGKR